MTTTDEQLQRDIEAELGWDPKVNAAQIGVVVDHGAVTLLGTVDTYAAKWAAEDATKRVVGVRTVAQALTVKLTTAHERTDTELAGALRHALEWDVLVPETITAKVEHGAVTLEGLVGTSEERDAAESACRHLTGVISIYNLIKLDPASTSSARADELERDQVKRDAEVLGAVRHALAWDVYVPQSVTAKIERGAVTLGGHVAWKYQRDAAMRVCQKLAGVLTLRDASVVKPEMPPSQTKEHVQAALRRQAPTDAESIQVDTVGGTVMLSGHAWSWESIEGAANAAWAAPGTTDVIDRMKVISKF